MDIKEHTTPEKLLRYSFLWSEARLLIAAVALFLGGVPPVLYFLPVSPLYGTVVSLLTLAWIISGLASLYLAYRWYKGGQTVFGGKDKKDMLAFGLMVVTGFNLGFAGISGTNIGMSIVYNKIIFIIAGIFYLLAAWHLYKRWKASGERLF